MVESSSEAEWARTAALLAWINNQNPYRKREIKAAELLPGGRDEKYTMTMSEAAEFFNGK